jgi:hypothetical protein
MTDLEAIHGHYEKHITEHSRFSSATKPIHVTRSSRRHVVAHPAESVPLSLSPSLLVTPSAAYKQIV